MPQASRSSFTVHNGAGTVGGGDKPPSASGDAAAAALSAAAVLSYSAADQDVELLAACASFQTRRAGRVAVFATAHTDQAHHAAHDAEWAAFDAVALFARAFMDAGRAAKAAVAVAITERHINSDGSGLDADLMFARGVLAEIAGMGSQPDGALLNVCAEYHRLHAFLCSQTETMKSIAQVEMPARRSSSG